MSLVTSCNLSTPGQFHGRDPARPHARSGRRGEAMRSLERAVAEGYRDADHLRNDPDLESLHTLDGFQELVTALARPHQ